MFYIKFAATPAEIVIIGEAAIVIQYGFRASTTDIDMD